MINISPGRNNVSFGNKYEVVTKVNNLVEKDPIVVETFFDGFVHAITHVPECEERQFVQALKREGLDIRDNPILDFVNKMMLKIKSEANSILYTGEEAAEYKKIQDQIFDISISDIDAVTLDTKVNTLELEQDNISYPNAQRFRSKYLLLHGTRHSDNTLEYHGYKFLHEIISK